MSHVIESAKESTSPKAMVGSQMMSNFYAHLYSGAESIYLVLFPSILRTIFSGTRFQIALQRGNKMLLMVWQFAAICFSQALVAATESWEFQRC